MFKQNIGKKVGFQVKDISVEVWDLSNFQLEGCLATLCVLKFWKTYKNGTSYEMWLVTTLLMASPQTL